MRWNLNGSGCFIPTIRYVCLLKCSSCQYTWLRSHKFLPCNGREAWQTTRCFPVNPLLLCSMCMTSLAGKCSLLTTATTEKSLWEGNKKSNMLLSVVKSWGALDVVSVVVTLHQTKRLIVVPDAHWLIPSPPDAVRLPSQAIIGLTSCSLTPALVGLLVRLPKKCAKFQMQGRVRCFVGKNE